MPVLEAGELSYTVAGKEILYGIDLNIFPNELTVIVGENGSGKSTLLKCLSGLYKATSGEVKYGSETLSDMSDDDLADWRGEHVGLVLQDSLLMNGIDVGSNVVGPHEWRGTNLDYKWISQLCGLVGISDKLSQDPRTLSGGERQRVAIARGLAHKPDVMFADEPTAALDTVRKIEIHELLKTLVSETALTLVLVSHDEISRSYADRIITLHDGKIIGDQKSG